MSKLRFLMLLSLSCLSTLAHAVSPCPANYWSHQTSENDIYNLPIQRIDLKNAADSALDPGFRPDLVKSTNDCGHLAWYETRRLEGYLDMYLATKDDSYLDRFINRADEIYKMNDIFTGKKDVLRNRVVFGWSSLKYSENFERHYHGVQAGIFSEIYARFSRTVWENKNSKYDSKAKEYHSIAIRTLDEVSEDWSESTGFYVFKPRAHKKYGIYPYNQGLAIGSAFLELFKISVIQKQTREAEAYKEMILKIGMYFKNAVKFESTKNRYMWKYAPDSYNEDMSHAGIDFNFIKKAYDSGLLFDSNDMERFANTLEQAYVPKFNKFGRYIDGSFLESYTNWYSLTCLSVVDYSQFSSNKTLLTNCEKAVSTLISNKNVLSSMDYQFFIFFSNGLAKLYKVKAQK